MNAASLREDVIERLEAAEEHIMWAAADATGDDNAMMESMRALVEIRAALNPLREELRKMESGPASPTEISGLAGALSRSAGKGADQ